MVLEIAVSLNFLCHVNECVQVENREWRVNGLSFLIKFCELKWDLASQWLLKNPVESDSFKNIWWGQTQTCVWLNKIQLKMEKML